MVTEPVQRGRGSGTRAYLPTVSRMPLVVAFDLDMTLIDTVPGMASTLTALGDEMGVDLPVEDLVRRIGPPLHVLLEGYLTPETQDTVVDRFRELYVDHAIHAVEALAGAAESIAAVRRHGGRVLVVTGKYEPNARRHVDHLALDIDHIEGTVVGVGKADVLRREGASILVGDHVHDVEGAHAGGRAQRLGADRRLHRGGAGRGRHRRGAGRPDGVPPGRPWLDAHLVTPWRWHGCPA